MPLYPICHLYRSLDLAGFSCQFPSRQKILAADAPITTRPRQTTPA